MKSMGTKSKDTGALVESKKPKIAYPSVTFSSKALPDVKDMKMGDTIEMRAKYRVKGLREAYDDKKEIMCEMDMLSCEVVDGPEDYKEAKERGLSRKDWNEIKGKKKNA